MKPLLWVGSSKKDLLVFPAEVRQEIGCALYLAQIGETYSSVKSLKGIDRGVYEIISNHDRNTYRAIYIVNLANAVYVIHAFQKNRNGE